MGDIGDFDSSSVETLLTQGLESATELKKQLKAAAPKHKCESLLENILSSYDNALKLLDCVALLGNGDPSPQIAVANVLDSSASEGRDSSMDLANKAGSKKRKALPKWREQVKVGFEGQLDDGFNWRKYGQKNILGCSNPRAYYRCTHRNTQGCLATKQVQRADEDPSIVEISYTGRHSCIRERIKHDKESAKKQVLQTQLQKTLITNTALVLKPEPDHEPNANHDHISPFSFPSHETMEMRLLSEPADFLGTTFSSPFLSPASSESYFSLSQCNGNDFGIVQSLETDFSEIISNLDLFSDDLTFDPHCLEALDYIE